MLGTKKITLDNTHQPVSGQWGKTVGSCCFHIPEWFEINHEFIGA